MFIGGRGLRRKVATPATQSVQRKASHLLAQLGLKPLATQRNR